ncbi:hypothetical protein M422DRAFT_252516 [Sphaerobolus stellatus SS14]|uniref:Uncharacterized protein n=1 Tax=Sphaerobolus stellatus (strain SS14) TaxID=990650 RepID=A0A0C9VYE4_SPHS4|nr:hypothetical protein M422DRAFT_252516 [Sphaerobolus stellatus SS14]
MVGDNVTPRGGIVSMEDISRSRAIAASKTPSKPTPAEDEEEDDPALDSDDSDRKSKMSFSYWGADKITLSPAGTTTSKARSPLGKGAVRGRASGPSSYSSRESSANAKFGTRLVNSPEASPTRPASRKAITPASRRAAVTTTTTTATTSTMDDVKSTTTSSKPTWNTSTRATSVVSGSTGVRRPRNTSQGSSQPPRTSKLSSPAPSEDSGVGLYRQMLAQDPSLSTSTEE